MYMFCVTLVNMEDTIVDGEMDNIVMLNETDIPGASLNDKAPSELSVVQLYHNRIQYLEYYTGINF